MFINDTFNYLFCLSYAGFVASCIVCSCRQVAGIITQPLNYFL